MRFVVDTGPRYNVVAIELKGLDATLEAEIRPLLATPTNRRFRAAPFQEELWEQDVKVVRSYMERNGYHRVRVEGELNAAPETPSRLTLVAHVDPGPRAVIEAVDININGVEGAAAIEPAEVIRVSGLEPGGPFDATGVVKARDRIVTHYYNEGFRQVDVQKKRAHEPDSQSIHPARVVPIVRTDPQADGAIGDLVHPKTETLSPRRLSTF